MKRLIISFILILLSTGTAEPFETSPGLSGYILNMPGFYLFSEQAVALSHIDQFLFLDITRLRLKPELRLGSSTTIRAAYEVTSFVKSGPTVFIPPSDKNFRQVADLTWKVKDSRNYYIIHAIDRLYLRCRKGGFELTAGRQRISWGTGRVWNPTDLFNPINPASPEIIEKLGADAIALKVFTGDLSDITAVIQPQEKLSNTNAAVRLRDNIRGYDFSILGGYFDERVVAGGDFAGSIGGAGFRGELLISARPEDLESNFTKWILGIDYQFTRRIYALVEYHFNGEGTENKLHYDFERLLRGEIINMNRKYLFFQSTLEVHPLVKLTFVLNSGINDRSGFRALMLSVSATDNLDIEAAARLTYGDDLDEFSYYPSMVYIKGIYYF